MAMEQADEGSRGTLAIIIAAQFAGTSLWFAGNAVLDDLRQDWQLPPEVLGHATSAVQFGFITGTLVFALLTLVDRFSARAVFGVCAWSGAVANAALLLPGVSGLGWLLASRFATGFFLAGVYPVGMKIAASWFPRSLGHAMGWLVGALVLGTAFPHLVRGSGSEVPWRWVLGTVSVIAATGGFLLLFTVRDGPHLPRRSPFDPGALPALLRLKPLRRAAAGYFGHMWELYAFWAFVPVLIAAKFKDHESQQVALWSFAVIAIGTLGCVWGGHASRKQGSAVVALISLAGSGLCCLLHPLMFAAPWPLYLGYLLVWGVLVIADSAQFSALTAQAAPKQKVGTALTAVTCVGFATTIISIQALNFLQDWVPISWLPMVLVVGPVMGWIAGFRLLARFGGQHASAN